MAADLSSREEPFVLAVVVHRRPASSAQPGNMAVITAAGGCRQRFLAEPERYIQAGAA